MGLNFSSSLLQYLRMQCSSKPFSKPFICTTKKRKQRQHALSIFPSLRWFIGLSFLTTHTMKRVLCLGGEGAVCLSVLMCVNACAKSRITSLKSPITVSLSAYKEDITPGLGLWDTLDHFLELIKWRERVTVRCIQIDRRGDTGSYYLSSWSPHLIQRFHPWCMSMVSIVCGPICMDQSKLAPVSIKT